MDASETGPRQLSKQQAAWLIDLQARLIRSQRWRSQADAEIVASEALDRLLDKEPNLVGTSQGAAWAFAVAQHVGTDLYRAGKLLRMASLEEHGHQPRCGPGPFLLAQERHAAEAERRLMIARFWRELRPLMRRAHRRLLRSIRQGLWRTCDNAANLGVSVRAVQRKRRDLEAKADLAWKRVRENGSPGSTYLQRPSLGARSKNPEPRTPNPKT